MAAETFRVFDDLHLYLTGSTARQGSATFGRAIFCTFLYFKESTCTSEFPFSDPFILNPLSEPYLEKDGHHIVDLSFYSEITIIEEPPRLCLHDTTQELGVSLNFKSTEAFQDMFDYLKTVVTVASTGLPGFYKIERLRPVESYQEGLDERIKAWMDEAHPEEDLLEAHSEKVNQFMTMIESYSISISAPSKHEEPAATLEQVDEAMVSTEKLKALVRRFSVPVEKKSDVWSYLIGLSTGAPELELKPYLKEQYLKIKTQWKTVTKSQYSRGSVLRTRFTKTMDFVNQNKKPLMTVVVTDSFILTLAFDVFMAIIQVYAFMESHLETVRDLFRVFLWMFVKNLEHRNREIVFIGNNNKEMDVDTLETLIFWSILYMMEAGEIRRMLESSESADSATEQLEKQIGDVIFLLHRSMYRHLSRKGLTNFKDLMPMITTHLSGITTLCACTDIWISALASNSFADFTRFMVISSLFFSLPTTISREPTARQPITAIIEQAFQCVDHRYFIMAAFVITEQLKSMISSDQSP